MEKREHSYPVGENVHWCSHYENSTVVPPKIKNKTTLWSSNSTPIYISKENEDTNSEMIYDTAYLDG